MRDPQFKGKRIIIFTLSGILNVFLIYSLTLAIINFSAKLVNLEIEELSENPGYILVTDLNGDGNEELIMKDLEEVMPTGQTMFRCISPFDPKGELPSDYFFEELIAKYEVPIPPYDINLDGKIDVPVIEFKDGRMNVRILDVNGKPIETFSLPGFESGLDTNMGLKDIEVVDIDGDQINELIILVNTGWNKEPRGVIVYNLFQKKKLWEFPCGCSTMKMQVVDLNNNKKKEIIFSGFGANNKVEVNGISDAYSYIITLDYKGEIFWPKNLGDYYTRLFFDIADVDNDQELEVLIAKSCHREIKPEPGEIWIRNGKDGSVEQHIEDKEVSFLSIFSLKNPKKNAVSIYVSDNSGNVLVFDEMLGLERRKLLEAAATILGFSSLGRKKDKPYLFVQTGDHKLHILNQQLKSVAEFTFPKNSMDDLMGMDKIIYEDETAVVLRSDKMYLISGKSIDLPVVINNLGRTGVFTYLFLLVMVNLLFFLLIRYPRGFLEKSKNKALIGEWEEFAQEIAHQMKTPLFTIQLEAERLGEAFKKNQIGIEDSDLRLIPLSIKEDVGKLNRMNKAMMKIIGYCAPNLKEEDINQLILGMVDRYRSLLGEKVEFELDLDPDSTKTSIDKKQVEEAFSNIIENALEAMPKGGKISISTLVVFSPVSKHRKEIEVAFEDTGSGMEKEMMGKIFTPHFSTKEDGLGIGLSIVKRIIDSHAGRIDVQSIKGAGTRIAVFLPVNAQ